MKPMGSQQASCPTGRDTHGTLTEGSTTGQDAVVAAQSSGGLSKVGFE